MLNSPQNEIVEKLEDKLCKGFGRNVLVGKNFQDSVVNDVYHAFNRLKENLNSENLADLEGKVRACEAAGKKWFPYKEIQESIAELRGTFEQTNGAGRKAKP